MEDNAVAGEVEVTGLEALLAEETKEPPEGVDLPTLVSRHLTVTQGDSVFSVTGRDVEVDVLRQFAEGLAVQ